jgi:cell division transport system permease protein
MSSTDPYERYRPVNVRRAVRPPSPSAPVPPPQYWHAVEEALRPVTHVRQHAPMPDPAPSRRSAAANPLPEPLQQPASKPAPSVRHEAQAPIIPAQSISGNALLAVIAIMTFLAAIALGAAVMVRSAAMEWQGQVGRELTIQIRPAPGRDMDWEVAQAVEIARRVPGIAEVRPYTREESARLLEPWLGSGLALDDLPVPRLIVVTLTPGAEVDLARLRQRLTAEVGGASLDDHRAFVDRMRAMTRNAVMVGMGVLGLMLAATILLVFFATRGAMSANKAIVEVLHFVGARNRYIAGQFQRHFLVVGLKGAAIGGAVATALFLGARLVGGHLQGQAGQEVEALAGSFVLSPEGYAGIFGLLVLVAAVTAITSRLTVQRTLGALE